MASILALTMSLRGGWDSEGAKGIAGGNALVAFLNDFRALARDDFSGSGPLRISPWVPVDDSAGR